MAPSTANIRTRDIFVLACMALLLFFWIFPVAALASLLSYKEIKKAMPWLGQMIDRNDKIRAIVQNSLPSAAMISLNALLPFILEGKVIIQPFPMHVIEALRCSFDICPGISREELGRIFVAQEVRSRHPTLFKT
jgi:hypothetical protein